MSEIIDSSDFEFHYHGSRRSAEAGVGQKYGLLALPLSEPNPARTPATSVHTLLTARTWQGTVQEQIAMEQNEHWRTWIGTIEWEEAMEQSHRLVLETMTSARPTIQDHENKQLSGRLSLIWRALLLAAPEWPFWGTSWLLTGAYRETKPPLMSLLSFAHLGPIVRPFYSTRMDFIHGVNERSQRAPDTWLSRWSEGLQNLHQSAAQTPEIIRLAIRSYEQALKQDALDLRIPSFVRAAESILALPFGPEGGRRGFSHRALQLIPSLEAHWFIGGTNTKDRLEQLYMHRNDCVHGKIPFFALRASGENGEDDAARFEFLAELIARESILEAFRRPGLLVAAQDRSTLESFWASGAIRSSAC